MVYHRALEHPDGVTRTFRSPVPWAQGTVTPTLNGRTLTTGFALVNAWTLTFDAPPQVGDVVGFFLTPAAG